MIFNFKTKGESKNKKSLVVKLQKIATELQWANTNFSFLKVPNFFNFIENELNSISEKEWNVAPSELKNVRRTTSRDSSGWFRAPIGSPATIGNTYIQPTGHMDEFFRTHSIAELMDINDNPSDQGGFAKRPMTTQEFYCFAFIYPFIRDKHTAILVAIGELSY